MTILTGDCIEVMAGMEADSVDAVVTDPPYGLEFMGKEWDRFWTKRDGKESRGKGRDPFTSSRVEKYTAGSPFQQWCEAWGREALRVTRPGGYLLAFGGTRTHHRLVCGLEDAGWIIRDELDWIYASGFPKGKANLKPAHEPIVLARKPGPLRPLAIDECRIGYTSAADSDDVAGKVSKNPTGKAGLYGVPGVATFNEGGRWPSNVLLSDPELFDTANPDVVGSGAVTTDGVAVNRNRTGEETTGGYGGWAGAVPAGTPDMGYGDSGGYSRFFIVPKADRADREPVLRGQLDVTGNGSYGHKRCAICGKQEVNVPGSACQCETPEWVDVTETRSRENAHPTVKPTDLMRHLVRLVTPVGGTVLDCFLGSGSTAIAAELEGFAWIGIEKEPEYVAIAEARLNGTQRGLGLEFVG